MKVRYDQKVDAIYFEFAKGIYAKSSKVSDSVLVDEDKKGKILGVEILDASKNIKTFNSRNTTVNFQSV